MFSKLVDVLKEVFWIKRSPKKRKPARLAKSAVKVKAALRPKKILRKSLRKAAVKPAIRPKLKPKPKISVVKKAPKSVVTSIDPSLLQVGVITHYFDRIKVCVVKLTQGTLLIGDKVTIAGDKTKFVQKVWSMQIESEDVKVAKKGQIIGIKVDRMVVVGDKVYK